MGIAAWRTYAASASASAAVLPSTLTLEHAVTVARALQQQSELGSGACSLGAADPTQASAADLGGGRREGPDVCAAALSEADRAVLLHAATVLRPLQLAFIDTAQATAGVATQAAVMFSVAAIAAAAL